MKVKITESDVKGMVFEGVKRAILENVNISDIIRKKEEEQKASGQGGKNPLYLALQAFQEVLPDAGNEIACSLDFMQGMQNVFDKATPEQQQAIMSAINRAFGYETIDLDLDPSLADDIWESVDRIVSKELNEVVGGQVYYVKSVECYDSEDDIVYVIAVSETGDDREAIAHVQEKFPDYEVVSVNDVDGTLDMGYSTTGARMELATQKAILFHDGEPIKSVQDLDW